MAQHPRASGTEAHRSGCLSQTQLSPGALDQDDLVSVPGVPGVPFNNQIKPKCSWVQRTLSALCSGVSEPLAASYGVDCAVRSLDALPLVGPAAPLCAPGHFPFLTILLP